jgi:hypothetical protein
MPSLVQSCLLGPYLYVINYDEIAVNSVTIMLLTDEKVYI